MLSAALGPPAAPAAGSFIAQVEGSPPSDQAVPAASPSADLPVAQLRDLSGQVSITVTLTERDNFTNEFRSGC